MSDEQKQDREWIALGGFRWERRATKDEAVNALLDELGTRAKGATIRVREVPAGAWVNQMGGIEFHTPRNWARLTPEEREAYRASEPEEVDVGEPEWLVEESVDGGPWDVYDLVYTKATAEAIVAEMTEEMETVDWTDWKYRVRKAKPGEDLG